MVPTPRRNTSFSCSNSRLRFFTSRNSADSARFSPGRVPASTSSRCNHLCRHDSEIPKSLATVAIGASPLRATAITSGLSVGRRCRHHHVRRFIGANRARGRPRWRHPTTAAASPSAPWGGVTAFGIKISKQGTASGTLAPALPPLSPSRCGGRALCDRLATSPLDCSGGGTYSRITVCGESRRHTVLLTRQDFAHTCRRVVGGICSVSPPRRHTRRRAPGR